MRNLAHPALKEATIIFLYTSNYCIAYQRPDVFCASVSKSYLAVITTSVSLCLVYPLPASDHEQLNCVLDGYAQNSAGRMFSKFSMKSYSSIYHSMLTLIKGILANPYHGLWLIDQLATWAREGW